MVDSSYSDVVAADLAAYSLLVELADLVVDRRIACSVALERCPVVVAVLSERKKHKLINIR